MTQKRAGKHEFEVTVIYYFIFVKAFHLGRVAWATTLGKLEIPHGLQQPQIVLVAPYQDSHLEM